MKIYSYLVIVCMLIGVGCGKKKQDKRQEKLEEQADEDLGQAFENAASTSAADLEKETSGDNDDAAKLIKRFDLDKNGEISNAELKNLMNGVSTELGSIYSDGKSKKKSRKGFGIRKH